MFANSWLQFTGGIKKTGLAGTYGLDVAIRVEIKPGAKDGRTEVSGTSYNVAKRYDTYDLSANTV